MSRYSILLHWKGRGRSSGLDTLVIAARSAGAAMDRAWSMTFGTFWWPMTETLKKTTRQVGQYMPSGRRRRAL